MGRVASPASTVIFLSSSGVWLGFPSTSEDLPAKDVLSSIEMPHGAVSDSWTPRSFFSRLALASSLNSCLVSYSDANPFQINIANPATKMIPTTMASQVRATSAVVMFIDYRLRLEMTRARANDVSP